MSWTLTRIRARIRELTGRPDTDQLSADNLLTYINDYYQRIFPHEINVFEFEGTTEFDTSDGTGEYDIPSTVLAVRPPVSCEDSDSNINFIDLYTDEGVFHHTYHPDSNNESDEEDEPTGMLVYGRELWLRPVPDDIYTIKYHSLAQAPTAFSSEGDTPTDETWGPAICTGTAIDILTRNGENDEAKELFELHKLHINIIARKQVQQIVNGTRAKPRF
jgi:hypothetical protein